MKNRRKLNESAYEFRKDISTEAAYHEARIDLPQRVRSAARAASGPAAAMETPLGVVAAAAGSTPGEYGEGRLAVGRRFESRRPEARVSWYREAGLGAGVVRGGGVAPRPLHRLRGLRRLRRGGSGHAAEVGIHQGEGHPCIVGIGAMDGAP
jgi:hypothetical protein